MDPESYPDCVTCELSAAVIDELGRCRDCAAELDAEDPYEDCGLTGRDLGVL